MSIFFHYMLCSSCMSELACSYMGVTKLRCMRSWYTSSACANGSARRNGRGKCNQPFTSLPNEGTPGVHGEELPAWENGPIVLLLPHMGYIYREVSYVRPSVTPSIWHSMARLLELHSALRFTVCVPPRCFPGAWLTSCTLSFLGFGSQLGSEFFLLLPRASLCPFRCLPVLPLSASLSS